MQNEQPTEGLTVAVGQFSARPISDDMPWGLGHIRPQAEFANADAQRALLTAVLESLQPVSETAYSACTDGRPPVRLLDGATEVPVREQLAGADIVSGFFAAELLADTFYTESGLPVAARLTEVASYLHDNGISPSSHLECGAATSFVTIMENMLDLLGNPAYLDRVRELVPTQYFDPAEFEQIEHRLRDRLALQAYFGISPGLFVEAARAASGEHAIEELQNDGRGVHGHVEEQIIRLDTPGYALNGQQLAAATGGRAVFAINDTRIAQLARLFARGDETLQRRVQIGLEAFTDATHATLAQGLPTYLVTLTSASTASV